jgi:hypothetical protein
MEPLVIDGCPAQLVIGWATLMGTGLMDVVFLPHQTQGAHL